MGNSKSLSATSFFYFANILISNVHLTEALRPNPKSQGPVTFVTDFQLTGMHVWCKLQPDTNDCDGSGFSGKFYHDIGLGDCKEIAVGKNCPNNLNVFDSVAECHEACFDYGEHKIPEKLAPNIFCQLQPDFGLCHDYFPRWYYDLAQGKCKGFGFSGCGGNPNRFTSYYECNAVCQLGLDTFPQPA